MNMLEVAIWSAATGAIAMVVLICVLDWAMLRMTAAAQGAAYNSAALARVVLLSGLAGAMLPAWDRESLQVAQVLIGPICVGLGNYWVRARLSARHRDRLMDVCLPGAGGAIPLLSPICLLLPDPQQLPAAAALVLVNTGLVL